MAFCPASTPTPGGRRSSAAKNDAALIASVQSTIGMDVTSAISSTQKATDLGRLSVARQTLTKLQADKVLSQADVNKVLAAIMDIESAISKL